MYHASPRRCRDSLQAPTSRFVDQNREKRSPVDWIAVALLIAVGFSIYFPNRNYRINGDALVYSEIIQDGTWSSLPIHGGYYALVHISYSLVSRFQSIPLERFLVAMNAFLGAAGIGVTYLVGLTLANQRWVPLVSAIVLMFSGRYFVNATTAEVYMAQTLFLLGAFALFLRGRPLWAGTSYAASVLISPLSLFFLFFFPLVAALRKPLRGTLLPFGILLALPAFGFAFLGLERLLWGGRGLLRYASNVAPDLTEGIALYAMDAVRHYGVLIPLMFLGIPGLLRLANRDAVWIVLGAFAAHLYPMAMMRGRGQDQLLPLDFFCAFLIACGLQYLHRLFRVRAVPASLLAIYVASSVYFYGMFLVGDEREYADDLREIRRRTEASNGSIIMAWPDGVAYDYYTRSSNGEAAGSTGVRMVDEERLGTERIDLGDTLYVLESYVPSRIATIVLGKRRLEERRLRNSSVLRAERVLGVQCRPFFSNLVQLHECHVTENSTGAER
jgi:hypothetical protein